MIKKRQKVVQIVRENEEQLKKNRNVLKHMGCMGIILNTSFQECRNCKIQACEISEAKVLIDHSQLIRIDFEHEKEILELC